MLKGKIVSGIEEIMTFLSSLGISITWESEEHTNFKGVVNNWWNIPPGTKFQFKKISRHASDPTIIYYDEDKHFMYLNKLSYNIYQTSALYFGDFLPNMIFEMNDTGYIFPSQDYSNDDFSDRDQVWYREPFCMKAANTISTLDLFSDGTNISISTNVHNYYADAVTNEHKPELCPLYMGIARIPNVYVLMNGNLQPGRTITCNGKQYKSLNGMLFFPVE